MNLLNLFFKYRWRDTSKELPPHMIEILVCESIKYSIGNYCVATYNDTEWCNTGNDFNDVEPLYWKYIKKPKKL